MNRYILAAIGDDRPGIVYRLTTALAKMGANLANSTMADLEGYFVVVVAFDIDDHREVEAILGDLQDDLADLSLTLSLREILPFAKAGEKEEYLVALRVYGGDRPGIVAGVTKIIYEWNGNVVELKSYQSSQTSGGTYVMVILAAFAVDLDFNSFKAAIQVRADALEVHVNVEEVEAESL
ncbi:MAG: hypothetical protein M0T78_00435 [Actinomycetota bacterium]|nr:hypothetical protein [Actinomycetota bacterium]